MAISAQQLARVLLHAHEQEPERIRSFMNRYFVFLEKNNLMALLPQIVRHLRLAKEQNESRQAYEITTHTSLSATALHDILKKIQAPEGVRIKKHVDPDMIGGIIIKHNGYIFDASIRSKLDDLQELLTQ